MSWHTHPHRTIAEQVCTDKELWAIRLTTAGASERDAARMLHISRRALRDRLDNALRKITNHPNYQKDPTT